MIYNYTKAEYDFLEWPVTTGAGTSPAGPGHSGRERTRECSPVECAGLGSPWRRWGDGGWGEDGVGGERVGDQGEACGQRSEEDGKGDGRTKNGLR